MKPAPCSCRVRISLILVERDRLSRKSRFSSPGTPNTYSTPSSSRQAIKRSEALVICVRPSLEVCELGSFSRVCEEASHVARNKLHRMGLSLGRLRCYVPVGDWLRRAG